MKKLSYKSTRYACYIAYVTQAMIGIYVPLLFVTFQDSYGISLAEITTMVTLNFFLQLLVDWAAALYADRVGYRICFGGGPYSGGGGPGGPHNFAGDDAHPVSGPSLRRHGVLCGRRGCWRC